MRVGIALGSNLGDRLAHLREGRRRLLELHNASEGPFLSSKIYESTPVECPDGSPPFLNAAIEFSTDLSPLDLLAKLQSLERETGRAPDHVFHGPRTLDLDILYFDNLRISHTLLTLPHPDAPNRLFVLKPLNDICPERVLVCQVRDIRTLCELLELQSESSCEVKFASYF